MTVSEHLQLSTLSIAQFLTPVINRTLITVTHPKSLKEGIIHPVHKNGKPKDLPGNYRGITFSPLIGKVLDKICLGHQQVATEERNHSLQFGFTPGRSGIHAAFLLTESLAEAKDRGTTLFVAAVDVQKAFDVIRHESLLEKLYEQECGSGRWKD